MDRRRPAAGLVTIRACGWLLVCILLTGCSTQPTLVRQMARRSVTAQNTERIVARGSAGGYAGAVVNLTNDFEIQAIWDSIYQSRPHDAHFFSGNRQLEFYTRRHPDKPSLTLWVNEANTCCFEHATERFRCPGINAVLTPLLKREHERRQRTPTNSDGTTEAP